jgi:predicted acylesterase/phospholipase RssA
MTHIEPLHALHLHDFDTLVFAGGGNRCWWQAGIVTQLMEHGWRLPPQLIGTSAGAAIATASITNDLDSALKECRKLYSANSQLFDWSSLGALQFRFAHEELYPAWLATLVHADNFDAIRSAKSRLTVAVTRPARGLGMTGSVAAGTLAYVVDKYVWNSVHPRLPRMFGLRQLFIDLHECDNATEAQTLLAATAAAPPFMPSRKLKHGHCIDGGYTDNAPIPQQSAEEKARTLVLLTRHYPHLPGMFNMNGRSYWQPSRKVPVSTWDCRAGATVEDAFALGIEDVKSAQTSCRLHLRFT